MISRPQYAAPVSTPSARARPACLDERDGLLGGEPGTVGPASLHEHEAPSGHEQPAPAARAAAGSGIAQSTWRHSTTSYVASVSGVVERVALDDHHGVDPRGLAPRQLDHARREVDPVHAVARLGEQEAQGGSATAEVGDPRGRRGQQGEQQLAPGAPYDGVVQPVVGRLVEGLGLGVPGRDGSSPTRARSWGWGDADMDRP